MEKAIKKSETKLNIVFSLLFQIITIICGLIVPRLIIRTFGSEINGTISSITQFLAYITILETGIGGVAKASLYEPLSKNNDSLLAKRMRSISSFFKKIGLIYLPYVLILAFILPLVLKTSFDYKFVCSMVGVLAISSISNYFFGLPSRILLQSDNKSYIVFLIDGFALIVNLLLTILLIKLNSSVLIVKLVSSFVFFIKPLIFYIIVKSHYKLKPVKNEKVEKLENRWNGFVEHLSFFIHNNTDIVLIAFFLSTSIASVYSVYSMIVSALVSLIYCVINSFNATFGFLYSQGKTEELKEEFKLVANISTFLTVTLFSICLFLITPFVKMYTNGVNDINYIEPIFGVLFILAEALYCLRSPLANVTLSAGKYKEVRKGAIIEVVVNIVLSLALIYPLGLIGLIIGTLIGMLTRLMDYIRYCRKNLIGYSVFDGGTRLIINAIGSFVGIAICKGIGISFNNELINWLINAVICSLVIFGSTFVTNLIFNRDLLSIFRISKKRK